MPGKASKTLSFDGKLERATFFGHSPDLPRIVEVELKNLRPNPEQPRTDFNAASIRDSPSIQQHGMIQPIAVMKDPGIRTTQQKFLIVAGERRYRAWQLLGRETMPAVITAGEIRRRSP